MACRSPSWPPLPPPLRHRPRLVLGRRGEIFIRSRLPRPEPFTLRTGAGHPIIVLVRERPNAEPRILARLVARAICARRDAATAPPRLALKHHQPGIAARLAEVAPRRRPVMWFRPASTKHRLDSRVQIARFDAIRLQFFAVGHRFHDDFPEGVAFRIDGFHARACFFSHSASSPSAHEASAKNCGIVLEPSAANL